MNKNKLDFINESFFNKKNHIQFEKRNNDFINLEITFSNKKIKVIRRKDIIKLNSKIQYFIKTMCRNCKSFNMKTFKTNFPNTVFEFDKRHDETKGFYKMGKKQEKIYFTDFDVLYHELLHMSTASKINKKDICGFSVRKINKNYVDSIDIGYGLNEGYTQFLAERYFNENVGETIYVFEVKIAKLLEKIIGKDIMEKSFFDMSLKTIIESLELYKETDSIYKFLNSIDEINEISIFEFEMDDYINNRYQYLLSNIYDFLWDCFLIKIDKILDPIEKLYVLDRNDWVDSIEVYNKNQNSNLESCCFELLDSKKYDEYVSKIYKDITNTYNNERNVKI